MAQSPTNYWRLAPAESGATAIGEEQEVLLPSALIDQLRPRDGIVLSAWDAATNVGRSHALGVVRQVDRAASSAQVAWVPAEVVLRPNPAGRRWWAQAKPFFRFANDVVARYALDDLFAEYFPEFENMDFGAPAPTINRYARRRQFATPGYVYVIRSKHGFKIGKTVNLKQRTRLFAVKLPFPTTLEHYAWFEDYTHAEREFHVRFQSKRLEGEWFDLNDQDLLAIKAQGKHVSLEGLQ